MDLLWIQWCPAALAQGREAKVHGRRPTFPRTVMQAHPAAWDSAVGFPQLTCFIRAWVFSLSLAPKKDVARTHELPGAAGTWPTQV